jgi:hypothetical protein
MEDDEIERQLKCKICDVVLHSWVLGGVPYKGDIQLDDGRGGGEAYIYIKVCTLNLLHLKIII